MSDPYVTIEIDAGEIVIEILASRAPRAAGYFLGFVGEGAYDGSTIYRSTTLGIEDGPRLVQGGPLARLFAPDGVGPASSPKRMALLEDFETTKDSGLRHTTGTLSMARDLLDTGHVISEFFLCLGAFPQLDAGGRSEPDELGFPAIGRITDGLGLLIDIADRPTGGRSRVARLEGEILSEQVIIRRLTRHD